MENFTELKQYKQLIMSRLKKIKLSVVEQRLLSELAAVQSVKLGKQKHENLGFADMPLFSVKQTEIF